MNEAAAGPSPPQRWYETPGGRRALAWMRRLLQYGIIAYLIWRVWQLGWREVLGSFPAEPLFYIVGLGLYAALPLGEVLGYSRLLSLPPLRGLGALLRKRTYNKEVLGYSGEVFFYFWASRELGVPERTAFHAVKANNILSSFCSTFWAFAVLAAVLASGSLPMLSDRLPGAGSYLLAGSAVLAVAAFVLIRFRRQLLGVPHGTALWLGAVHLGRLMLVTALRILQWAVVLPEIPLQNWFGLLAVEIVITRLPFLPGKDLFFAGAAADLAPAFGVPGAAMVAIVVAQGALDRLLNLLVLLLPAGQGGPKDRAGHAAGDEEGLDR